MSARENKYVIIKSMGMETPIILPAYMNHCDVVKEQKIVSAGMCKILAEDQKISVACYGESHTLKVHSRGEKDASVIEFFLTSTSNY